MSRVSHARDRVRVSFDEPNLVAGLMLAATVAVRLGLEQLGNSTVRLFGRVGGARPGRKVLTLVYAMGVDASHTTTPACCAPMAPSGSCPSE